MPSLGELLERESERVGLQPGGFERLARRRDRMRRNQRIRSGVLALVVSLIVMAALVRAFQPGRVPADRSVQPSPPVERVDFVGFPPEGARASSPAIGEWVLRFSGTLTDGRYVELFVYADGRMIWQRWADVSQQVVVPEGVNQTDTGYIEQRLTPEGIEQLRSRLRATGLFAHSLKLQAPHPSAYLQARIGDGSVRVDVRRDWAPRQDASVETPAQARALDRVEAFLADPTAWLSSKMYAAADTRTFVASRYLIVFDRGKPDLSQLPPEAAALLASNDELFRDACQVITTDQARAILQALVDGGITPSDNDPYTIAFELAGPSYLHLHPALPDMVTC